MSVLWGRHAQTNDQLATTSESEGSHKGQGHDRILPGSSASGISSTIAMSNEEPALVEITAGQKMLSAMSGSLLTSLLVTPLDVVRVRLQSQPVQSSLSSYAPATASAQTLNALPPNLGVTSCCREVFFANNNAEYCMAVPRIGTSNSVSGAECVVEETQKRTFNSTFDGLRKIARNEGLTTLWRGLSPTLVMTVPANIIYFTGYEWLRSNKQSPISRMSDNFAPLMAGATARVFAATLVSPIEMLKTRMQASRSTGGSHFTEATKKIGEMVSSHGYTSLWRGLTLTLWRDVPFSGIYWWGYENVRGVLTDARERSRGRTLEVDGSRTRARGRSQSRENHTATFTDSFIAGATSGAVASILTMPFDVGKTRRQVFKDTSSIPGEFKVLAPEERSMPRFLLHILREEGASGLWRGWIPRTLKVAPACAIMISCYEIGKKAFRGMNERAEQTSSVV